MPSISINADASELIESLESLSAELASKGVGIGLDTYNRLADLIRNPSQLFSTESRTTSGTSVAMLFKPSESLLELLAAVRAI